MILVSYRDYSCVWEITIKQLVTVIAGLLSSMLLALPPICDDYQLRTACHRQWTVLVYMNGDNDLSPYTFIDIDEMEKVGSSANVDIIVQQDTIESNGSRRYHIVKEKKFNPAISSPILATLSEQDSGKQETIIDFLDFGVTNFPSRNYMVVVWSHGAGYPGGISFDYTSASQLTITELQGALTYLQDVHLEGRRVAIYASDACLMQSLEVIYQLRQQARFIIGSANRIREGGFPYREIISFLNQYPYQPVGQGTGIDSAYRLALEIPQLYLRNYLSSDNWATLTSVVAQQLARQDRTSVVQSLSRLSEALQEYLRADPLFHPLTVLVAIQQAYQFAPATRDVRTFLSHLRANVPNNSKVAKASDDLLNALQQIVLKPLADLAIPNQWYTHSKGFGYGTVSSGLTLWLPVDRQQFLQTKNIFQTTTLNKKTAWHETMSLLHR